MELLAVIVGLENLKTPQYTCFVVSDSKVCGRLSREKMGSGWEKKDL
jgi:ribonuclease HI